jgi:hypothetical protein
MIESQKQLQNCCRKELAGGWWSGSSGRVPAQQPRGLKFECQYHKKEKREKKELVSHGS